MRRLWLGVLTTIGCNQIVGIDQLHDDQTCRGTLARICAHPLRGDIELSSDVPLDTDTDPRCETVTQPLGNPALCVISARDITIVGTLETSGSRPLVLFANRSILLQTGATLDASSARGGRSGPGASSELCKSLMIAGTSGGGAGGSFGGKGGDGGNGAGAGMRGLAAAAIMPSALSGVRGSCGGDAGGASVAGASAAPGGDSGGTVYLLAAATIDMQATSTIDASGAGGTGNELAGGGGGGGAGGLVALEAPQISITGQIVAHGGAGAAGAGPTQTTPANSGEDGAKNFADRSLATQGTTAGADGGRGSYGTLLDGISGTSSGGGGGGGGGGGAGIVWISGTLAAPPALVTPPPVMP